MSKIEHYELNENNQRTKLSRDVLGDGSIDSTERYDLDILGRIAKTYFDRNNDGVDYSETYTHDANGNIIVKHTDALDDGSIEKTEIYTLNALGQVEEKLTQNKNGEEITSEFTNLYNLDIYGNILSNKEYLGKDIIKDSIPYSSVEYRYDALNQRVYSKNTQNDEVISERLNFTYDSYGNRVAYTTLFGKKHGSLVENATVDYNSIGLESSSHSLLYDSEGRLTREDFRTYKYTESNSLEKSHTRVLNDKGIEIQVMDELYLYNKDNPLQSQVYLMHNQLNTETKLHIGRWGANINYDVSFELTPDKLNTGSAAGIDFTDRISEIYLSGDLSSSKVTLDAASLSKLAKDKLNIIGASKIGGKDSIILKNSGDFTKLDNSEKIGYDQYTYVDQDDNSINTLFIDSAAEVIMG